MPDECVNKVKIAGVGRREGDGYNRGDAPTTAFTDDRHDRRLGPGTWIQLR